MFFHCQRKWQRLVVTIFSMQVTNWMPRNNLWHRHDFVAHAVNSLHCGVNVLFTISDALEFYVTTVRECCVARCVTCHMRHKNDFIIKLSPTDCELKLNLTLCIIFTSLTHQKMEKQQILWRQKIWDDFIVRSKMTRCCWTLLRWLQRLFMTLWRVQNGQRQRSRQ